MSSSKPKVHAPWNSKAKRSDLMSDQEVDGWVDACVKAGAKYVKIIISDDG